MISQCVANMTCIQHIKTIDLVYFLC